MVEGVSHMGGFNPLFIGARLLIRGEVHKVRYYDLGFNPLFIGARLLISADAASIVSATKFQSPIHRG